jgi:hypothetical protein
MTTLSTADSTPNTGSGYAKANQVDRVQGLGLNVLQQLAVHSHLDRGFGPLGRLGIRKLELELVSSNPQSLQQTPDLAVLSPAESRGFLLFAMAFSGAAAVFISYSTAWCIRTTSSTTYR